jgi:hypothetical protein
MIALLLVSQLAATTPKPHVIEGDFHVGLSVDVGEQAVQELAIADRRSGETISASFLYKTRYFLSPFIDVGYTLASSGGTIVPAYQVAGPTIADNRLSLWNLSSGLTFDTWRLRFQGGLGIGFVVVRTRLAGDESRADRAGPLAFFAVGLDLVRAPGFDLALKLRALLSSQHLDMQVLSIGLEIRGDLLRF